MTTVEPDIYLEEANDSDILVATPWNVILYNDDFHSMDEVVRQVQKATGCSLETAAAITVEAHNSGRAICYSGSLEECTKAANILKEISLHVEIDQPATF